MPWRRRKRASSTPPVSAPPRRRQRRTVADAPYFLQVLGLTGFRAYLHPKTFDFSKKRCLAIFAANGNGKSSVIDALEFMFSKDCTLERLCKLHDDNQRGPAALA